ncbi:MAG: aminotransferase class III-fold pyridoxal phosphate-dependent enzyme [Alphaproteobacteria bacterium]|nr:aminotransferase class III-fold pyridoxal phosphate-dependent enzyme [Alphaproteobacteria bacterium]
MPQERYKISNDILKRAERVIPLAAQTFSKSRIQFPVPFAPLFLDRGKGGRVWDVDGNEYVDLICALMPVTLGYCDPDTDAAIKAQLEKGISFSLSTVLEVELAERLVEIIPCAEMVRFGKNGTDATSAAIRLARAFTGKDHVIACGYHGWQDWYIGATARNLGVPSAVGALTHKLPYNDLEAVKARVAQHKGQIAALILEPISSNEPAPGYLEALRVLTREEGIVLIFDEVITGFRVHLGGAQAHCGTTPDLAAFGKGMGNGMPISAVMGRADIMGFMEKVFYSGTFGGETLSLAASIAVIDKMKRENVITRLWKTGEKMLQTAQDVITANGLENILSLSGVAPWKVLNFKDHKTAPKEAIKTRFMIEMLRAGVLIAGSHNICFAHNDADIAQVRDAYEGALGRISQELKVGTLLKNLEVPAIYPVFQVRG